MHLCGFNQLLLFIIIFFIIVFHHNPKFTVLGLKSIVIHETFLIFVGVESASLRVFLVILANSAWTSHETLTTTCWPLQH
jgi:hypothetical protein